MLYLVHHADAVSAELDPQRPLSESGLAHANRIAREASQRGVRPGVIWHSGKLRARQTAEAFWRHCNPLAELAAIRGLQPDDPPEWIRDLVSGDAREIMVVGHMPHLPRAYALLMVGLRNATPSSFPPHGVVALAPEADGWREAWRLE